MTETAWKKALRAVETKGSAVLSSGSELIRYKGRYGYEYSLRAADGNTVICTWNLNKIKEICVD